MDIREVIRNSSEVVVGHKPVTERLNLKNEVRRFSVDPLYGFLIAIDDKYATILNGDIGRYQQSYFWYTLCLKRTLEHYSIERRWDREIRCHSSSLPYSARQTQIARKRRAMNPYQELDYQNLIIHTCILLDRVIALSRRFLVGKNLPSFTSFAQHKAFLQKDPRTLDGRFHDYAEILVKTTDWFEIPVKVLRDKYLMHSAERHFCSFGWPPEGYDRMMITVISASPHQEKILERVKVICFSPRRLARDIEAFLSWFSEFGQSSLIKCPIG